MGKSVNKSTNPYICPPVTSWSIFRREKRVIFDVGAKQNQRQRGASGGKEEEGGRRKEQPRPTNSNSNHPTSRSNSPTVSLHIAVLPHLACNVFILEIQASSVPIIMIHASDMIGAIAVEGAPHRSY
jgi:hypothetical protein